MVDIVTSYLFPVRPPFEYNYAALGDAHVSLTCTAVPMGLIKLPAAYIQTPNATTVVLYAHGNMSTLPGLMPRLRHIADTFQVSVLAFEYPGYAPNTGTVTIDGVDEACLVAYRYLVAQGWRPHQMVFWGRSVGSAVVAKCARLVSDAGHRLKGVVLVTPFRSLADVAAYHTYSLVWWVVWWLGNHYTTFEDVTGITAPTIVVVADHDEVCPKYHGYDVANSAAALWELVEVSGAHNEVDEVTAAWESFERLLARP